MFSRKNDLRPFEDVSNVEFLCNKNNTGFFLLANHSKKRPQNLTIGRVFNENIRYGGVWCGRLCTYV